MVCPWGGELLFLNHLSDIFPNEQLRLRRHRWQYAINRYRSAGCHRGEKRRIGVYGPVRKRTVAAMRRPFSKRGNSFFFQTVAASLSNPSEASGDNRWHGTQVFNVNPLPPLSHKQKPNFCEVETKATIRQKTPSPPFWTPQGIYQGRRRKPTTQNSNRGLNAISRIKELRKKPYKGWMKRLEKLCAAFVNPKVPVKMLPVIPRTSNVQKSFIGNAFYKFNKFSFEENPVYCIACYCMLQQNRTNAKYWGQKKNGAGSEDNSINTARKVLYVRSPRGFFLVALFSLFCWGIRRTWLFALFRAVATHLHALAIWATTTALSTRLKKKERNEKPQKHASIAISPFFIPYCREEKKNHNPF